jgi:hypothetical protein
MSVYLCFMTVTNRLKRRSPQFVSNSLPNESDFGAYVGEVRVLREHELERGGWWLFTRRMHFLRGDVGHSH